MTERPQPPGMLSFAIGEYTREGYENLPDAKDELARVQELFGRFGVEGDDWGVGMRDRGYAAVAKRLEDWSGSRDGRDTVLYWIGHGEQADGPRLLTRDEAAFLHPFNVAGALRARGHEPSRDFWTFAVIDTCHSREFVNQTGRELPARTVPTTRNTHGVLLFGVSGSGPTRLGRFGTALRQAVEFDLRGKEIHIRDLAAALKELLPGSYYTEASPLTKQALLVRRGPWLPVRGPLDMMDELDAALRGLAPDRVKAFTERARHARDAQYGDVTWHFRGHHNERREVVDWLRESRQGMLVVTGQPGAGKSAFLGHLLVQSQPALREALDTADLVVSAPADERPEDHVFTAALTLRNLSTAAAVTAIADACRLGGAPSPRDLRQPAQWLMGRVRSSRRELTLLLDGLDEAQDPLSLADGVLRELAALPDVRLLVGTRPSTAEEDHAPTRSSTAAEEGGVDGPSYSSGTEPPGPAPHILEALGVDPPSSDGVFPDVGPRRVTLTAERDNVEGYVRDRLAATPGEDPPGLGSWISRTIQRSDWSFLVARLAVHEILAHRHKRSDGNVTEETEQQTEQLKRLLSEADPRRLFAAAVERLRDTEPAHEDMLRALAYAQGAGLPPTGATWATVVAALTGGPAPDRAELKNFTRAAAPYVSLDDDHGVTVYRLAHHTFREHFLSERGGTSVHAGHTRIVRALLDGVPAFSVEPLHPYLSRYLSGHAVAAGMEGWRLLAARTDVLDQLDARALGTDAVRSLLGSDHAPEEITGIIGARHQLVHAQPRDRRGIREISMARQAGTVEFPEPRPAVLEPQAWTVHRAWLRRQDPHTTMEGRARTGLNALAVYPHRHGVDLLAAGDAEGAVRVWRPTGERVHMLPGPRGKEVRAVLPLTGPGGQTLLAVGGRGDEIRLWRVRGMQAKVLPPLEHPGGVRSMTALADGERVLLASGGDDGVVRLWDPWDPETREPFRMLSTVPGERAGRSRYQGSPERRWVRAMTTYTEPAAPGRSPRTLLVTAHRDHIRIWDPFTESADEPLREWPTGHRRISTIRDFAGPGGRPLLASCGEDGTVRIWDPATGVRTRPDLTGHTGRVNDLAVLAGPDDRTMLASVGDDNTLRLWDPHRAGQVGEPWATGHRNGIRSLRVFTGPGHRTMLATAGQDGRVKTWDPVHRAVWYDSTQRHSGSVHAVTWYRSGRNRISFATASSDKTARLWDPARSGPSRTLDHPRTVRSVTAVQTGGPAQSLATACADGNIYVWNPDPASPGGRGRIEAKPGLTALVSFPGPGKRRALLAGAYGRKVRLWDAVARTTFGPEFSPDHDKPITAMAWFREPVGKRIMLVTADRGRTLRVWDAHGRTPRAGPFHLPSGVESLRAFEAKGRSLIAVGGRDGAIRVMDAATGAEEHLLRGHSLPVTAIAWAGDGPEGPRLISGSRDGNLRVWDPLGSAPSLVVPIGVAVRGLSVWDGRVAIACTEGLVIINLPALREIRSAH
ncbi:hypothetical protein [Streptomyces sp. NBC_00887]|uniref:hypothetical protein n=1 Tax=Streptomyces sp. NBC_00887 TaxID=2975859 RepID=UPI003863AA66|nr:hypothetical protein OG844_27915 [Streptomyces sp. NBC_00887]